MLPYTARRDGVNGLSGRGGLSISSPATLALKQRIGLIAAPLALLLLWWAPLPTTPTARHAIAIAAFMIVLWATEAVDHALAGFLGVFLFWALKVAPPQEAFSGFASETPWFLFGAMLIGSMAGKTGLARRIAYVVTAKVGKSASLLLLAFIVVDFVLTFLIPSGIARVTLLATVAVSVVEASGAGKGSNLGRGLLIIITYTAALFDKMLIAGAASILARGIIQDVGQVRVLYSQWFIAYLPCDLITIFACWWLVKRLYPPEPGADQGLAHLKHKLAELGPWTHQEKKCALLLGTAVTLWMTDFLHHISPSVIGLGIGLLAFLPGIRLLTPDDARALNYGALWFTAAALSMSRILASTKGLDLLTDALVGWMGPYVTGPFSSALVLYWTAFIYHFFLANETAMLSTSLPVVLRFAMERGMDPLATGMIWTFAAGGKIFVYQSAVLIVGYSYGYFDAKDMLKVGFALTVIESLILLLLVPLYWPLIGIS